MPTAHQTVAEVVLDHSECAEVFQRHRIDFCCRGELTLEQAAVARKLDVARLLEELSQAIAARTGPALTDPRALSTPQLVSHLLEQDAWLRRALPFVRTLAVKVSRVHGDHNPKLRDLEQVVLALEELLTPHLEQEAKEIFPLLAEPAPDAATVARELDTLTADHAHLTSLFHEARTAADEFTLPDWACNSYRMLFSELAHLEAMVLTRVHLEHHVLRPRFAAA